MNYKINPNNDYKNRMKAMISWKEEEPEKVQVNESSEEMESSPIDLKIHLDVISDQKASIDKFTESLHIIAQQSDSPKISLDLFNSECYNTLYQQLNDFEKFSDPRIIFYFLVIMNNILSLPGKELVTIFMSDFQVLFQDIVNHYSTEGPPIVISIIFEIFLTIMRPPVDISFVDYYIPFFAIYLNLHNPLNEPELTLKSFKCCNKMFDIKHCGIQKKMLENNFLKLCYIHMNHKTPSFFEACQLTGNICYLKRESIFRFEDDFFTELIPDLLNDEDDKIVGATLRVLESLSSNETILEILINEDKIFKKILKMYERGFEVKKRSLELLTTLIESEKPILENKFIDHGTLDFFVEYLFSEDIDICRRILAALFYLIDNFAKTSQKLGEPGPFIAVLKNSTELINSLKDLSLQEGILDDIIEASNQVLNLITPFISIKSTEEGIEIDEPQSSNDSIPSENVIDSVQFGFN